MTTAVDLNDDSGGGGGGRIPSTFTTSIPFFLNEIDFKEVKPARRSTSGHMNSRYIHGPTMRNFSVILIEGFMELNFEVHSTNTLLLASKELGTLLTNKTNKNFIVGI